MWGVDCARYGNILEELDNYFIRGTNSYPNLFSVSYILIENRRQFRPNTHPNGG